MNRRGYGRMKILVNHLTRMHGGNICVAGVDVETRRHVRPVLGYQGMPASLLARYGGPFDVGRIVDLGRPRPRPVRPHVEDVEFARARLRFERNASPEEFWSLLQELARPRLREIFGTELQPVGRSRCATELGQGLASLGCFRPPRPPELYLGTGRRGTPQVRIRLGDGQLRADAAVTDLRLYQADHATPHAEVVRGVARWIRESECVMLTLGLTRKYRPSDDAPYRHWLQVNNVHLKEDPIWQLG